MKNRRDGKFVKITDDNHILMPYLKPKRSEAEVYIDYKLDVTEMLKYIDKKKKENPDINLTYFHVFVTAISKLVYNRPLLNRFVVNKQYYDRNEVSISFVAKQEFSDHSSQIMSVVKMDENDNLDTISKKISSRVNKVRDKKNTEGNSSDFLGKLPKIVRDISMFILQKMDTHDLLPESLIKNNIYYSSILVTDIGSLGCGAIYHNLTNFGTNSILIAIGNIHKEVIVNKDGKEEIRDICDFGVTVDERIADGFYFIKSMKLFEEIFKDPKVLEDAVNAAINIDK